MSKKRQWEVTADVVSAHCRPAVIQHTSCTHRIADCRDKNHNRGMRAHFDLALS